MRAPRTLIAIPPPLAAGIDQIAGSKTRTEFIVDVLEREIPRAQQLAALEQAAGCWSDQDHPELADGGAAYVARLRREEEDPHWPPSSNSETRP